MRPKALALVVPTVGLALMLTGCPKRPMVPEMSAPPPAAPAPQVAPPSPPPAPASPPVVAAPAAPQTPAPAPAPVAPPTPAPTPPPAPLPKEYRPNDALKPINFAFDQAVIRPGDAKTLEASAAWLKANPNQLVLIEGHCDERGTDEYNLALGDRRARAAVNFLVTQGIPLNRITMISYGKERPRCRERTEACWATNRRDEFLTKER
jgi:peptidoglycan-associated lipoprotein